LVDDGSTDDTAYIAAQFPRVRYIHQPNHGLSHARNSGAAAAKGEVLAYTDSDCMVDGDWLYYLIGTLVSGEYAGVRWPNVTPLAFLKQQDGYGEAESLLRFKHLIFFGPTGTAKWRGQIYGTPRFSWFINRPVIYHGIFGEGFFQSIYPRPQSEVAAYLSSIEWFALAIFLFGLGIFLPALRIVPYLMLGGTFCVALSYMVRAPIEPKFDTVHARLLVMVLAFAQPLVR